MSRPTCESCGAPADVKLLTDGSTWCASCDAAARRMEYDNDAYEWIGLRVAPSGETAE